MWLLAKRTQGKGRKDGGGGGEQSFWVEGYSGLALVVVAFCTPPPPRLTPWLPPPPLFKNLQYVLDF